MNEWICTLHEEGICDGKQHGTPSPCKAILDDSGKASEEVYEIRLESGPVLCYVPFPHKAQALYIEKAVNCHEEMLQGYYKLSEFFKGLTIENPDNPVYKLWLTAVEAILAKAS